MSIKVVVYNEEIDILLEAIKEHRENYKFDEEIVRVCVLLVDRIMKEKKVCDECGGEMVLYNPKKLRCLNCGVMVYIE